VIVPLATAGRPFGLVVLKRGATPYPFNGQDLATVDDLARRLALTVENARISGLPHIQRYWRHEKA